MVFMFRDHTNIQKLSVPWEGAASGDSVVVNVNRWILFAIKQDVQEITIRIGESHVAAYEIPHRLLNCKSLRKLEIYMYGNGRYTDIILPKSMNLTQLKVLILEGLSFSNVELRKRLISSCPVLEILTAIDCDLQTDNHRESDVLNEQRILVLSGRKQENDGNGTCYDS
ncbi:putative F-box/FBD/LRR-repeat protein At1g66290 [Papaver somniferum]|nr:putative F-box/FBD/LRR-repeat protein At1g66290 [Papaver somniferum]XP_026457007.1 putative F-box/FBD/LRR-repeat protein At1g66290 [Papaver somniferum]XP_026457008.1 putative F-box/FBD/LRR-repeat protein At1g66290 [Papaver somniferum]